MNMKKIDYKKLALYIAIPLVLGVIVGLITMKASLSYNGPVPRWIFPVVWSILYVLMGISSYIIYTSDSQDKNKALLFYGIQLVLNSLWTLFFFRLNWFLFSFFWLCQDI